MNIKPLLDRIIVAPNAAKKISEGGIHLPDNMYNHATTSGTVIEVGPGLFSDGALVPVSLKIGDIVIYHSHLGTKFETGGSQIVVIREADVLAVVEE